jgi:hypothetical protein
MKTERIRDGFMPWAGLALGTIGFFLAHQIGSDATFQDCSVGAPLIVVLGTLIGLLAIGVGALGSWRIYAAEGETPARMLIAVVGMLACALYLMGVLLPFIAALVIPGCWA